jgi:hypothetical protein
MAGFQVSTEGRRLRVSRRMVVNEDERRGVPKDSRLEDFPWVNERGGECPDRHEVKPHNSVATVEEKDDELLTIESLEALLERSVDILRLADGGSRTVALPPFANDLQLEHDSLV